MRLRILDWISDDSSRRKQKELAAIRHPNTGEWILDTREFQNWAIGRGPRALWLYGSRKCER